MKWPAVLVAAVVLAGCHAPRPSLNVLAPYGPPRVPPPSTSNAAPPNTYYNGGASPTVPVPAVPGGAVTPSALQSTPASMPSRHTPLTANDSWKPVRTKATADPAPTGDVLAESTGAQPVQQASYDGSLQATTTAADADSPSTASRVTAGSSVLRLKGMPATDATGSGSSAPGRFVPSGRVMEISQLPSAPATTKSPGTVVASSKASDRVASPASKQSAAESTLRWRSRASAN